MITRGKQDWSPGRMVKVGFMNLRVLECIPTPGDYMPDMYVLENPKNGQQYEFTPHHGLEKVESNYYDIPCKED